MNLALAPLLLPYANLSPLPSQRSAPRPRISADNGPLLTGRSIRDVNRQRARCISALQARQNKGLML